MKKNGKTLECKICKKSFYVAQNRLLRSHKVKYCSSKCYHIATKGSIPWNKGLKGFNAYPRPEAWKKNISKSLNEYYKTHTGKKGEKSPSWRGGQYNNKGYVYIYQPFHPKATKRSYIKRSHLIMEKYLGRFLDSKEVVHHINGIKNDDRLENLKLFATDSLHLKFHYSKGSKFGKNNL